MEMKDYKKAYVEITKTFIKDMREKGVEINSVKVEINGNEARDDYAIKTTYNL